MAVGALDELPAHEGTAMVISLAETSGSDDLPFEVHAALQKAFASDDTLIHPDANLLLRYHDDPVVAATIRTRNTLCYVNSTKTDLFFVDETRAGGLKRPRGKAPAASNALLIDNSDEESGMLKITLTSGNGGRSLSLALPGPGDLTLSGPLHPRDLSPFTLHPSPSTPHPSPLTPHSLQSEAYEEAGEPALYLAKTRTHGNLLSTPCNCSHI